MDKMASVIHLFVPTGFSKNLSDSSSWPGGMGGHASMRICTSRRCTCEWNGVAWHGVMKNTPPPWIRACQILPARHSTQFEPSCLKSDDIL